MGFKAKEKVQRMVSVIFSSIFMNRDCKGEDVGWSDCADVRLGDL